MKLSVIIVNYNVKFFLEQCLFSVEKSMVGIDGEIFVVDNNSVDGSVAMIENRFPSIKLIANSDNKGFSKANNQALAIAKGEYSLLLNPDTVVEESTFRQCIEFMDAHPRAGALGPRMIDGKGCFLPESKRGLPTPETAFYKIFGITRLFPKSNRFARYYLGSTSPDITQEVDVLTGAFMFIRSEVLQIIGFLDEEYFMYGEDIDLSYRIQKSGYLNYYFADTTIIHYKGESTKRGSLNYVIIFYRAMQIFAMKHFKSRMANNYVFVINMAIWFRAWLSITRRYFLKAIPVLSDSIITSIGFILFAKWWQMFWFHSSSYYPTSIFSTVIPIASTIFVGSNILSGGYQTPFSLIKNIRGIAFGAIVILIVYALLPLDYRFSRTLIIGGFLWALISSVLTKVLLSLTGAKAYRFNIKRKRRIAIAGKEDEIERITRLLSLSEVNCEYSVFVCPDSHTKAELYAGTLSQLMDIIQIHNIDEIIFSARDISAQEIIGNMKKLTSLKIDFKIASPNSLSVIGSNSSDSAGDFYTVQSLKTF